MRKIGEGGNGCVYKAQGEDGNMYAVKVVVKNKLTTEKLQRFKNEINFCEKYSHENVIKILDHGVSAKNEVIYIFYVMSLYECNLRALMKQGIKTDDCIDNFLQISNGLRFAHSKGCIHRDIKPENILVNSKRKCVICDFGIAHFSEMDKVASIRTKETSRLANFSYHAPEQIGDTLACRATTDIFALGYILNEMFTGNLPMGERYKKIASVDADYSFLDEIIVKMIAQNPQERYQNIDDMLKDYGARREIVERERKIKILSMPTGKIEIDDNLYNHPIEILDVTPQHGELIMLLSDSVNDFWENIYRESLSTYTCGDISYKDFRFYGKEARCDISSMLGYANTKDVLGEIVRDFKNAVKIANQNYRSALERKVKENQATELRRRQAKIKQLQEESELQKKLRNWLK